VKITEIVVVIGDPSIFRENRRLRFIFDELSFDYGFVLKELVIKWTMLILCEEHAIEVVHEPLTIRVTQRTLNSLDARSSS
jgi:hypothetical protein